MLSVLDLEAFMEISESLVDAKPTLRVIENKRFQEEMKQEDEIFSSQQQE